MHSDLGRGGFARQSCCRARSPRFRTSAAQAEAQVKGEQLCQDKLADFVRLLLEPVSKEAENVLAFMPLMLFVSPDTPERESNPELGTKYDEPEAAVLLVACGIGLATGISNSPHAAGSVQLP